MAAILLNNVGGKKKKKENENSPKNRIGATLVDVHDTFLFFFIFPGDGNVSFEEFVEIVSNIGANETAPTDQDQEEQELRDAFRVRLSFIFFLCSLK